uniref:Cytochrome-b5 reductase n=1 Tax=Electrophorus electricus TaxID=8005 RepID=A0AAY5F0F6_ELEEL
SKMQNAPSFPGVSSQQRVAPLGQTRNKVALNPGHSLMDWIRLTKSGRDMTGLKGRLIEVTEEELKRHKTRNDCWTCIRGMVYNISAYMDFHPGGEGELMRIAGIDGTDLFDQVHRWVNYESMLKECLVGRMMVKASTTDDAVNIVIYTKQKVGNDILLLCCVPWCVCVCHSFSLSLSCVLSPSLSAMVVQTVNLVGKVNVHLRKTVNARWTQLGQPLQSHDSFILSKDRELFYRDCMLVSKKEVTHCTWLFCFRLPPGACMQIPVGRHVYLKASVQGCAVVKPYTPVDQVLMPQTPPSTQGSSDIYLMIKVYPDGVFTPHLNNLDIGAPLSVSSPEGAFTLHSLSDVTHLYLLAAGTGFTPMARLLHLALQELSSIRKTKLMFFNRQEKDILWHSELEQICAEDARFQVEYVLSEPSASWTGRRGHVDVSKLQDFLQRPGDSKCLVCVCGPTGFAELTVQLVKQQGFSEEEMYVFQG